MRIISKYRDYYDCAMGLGIDTTKTYLREEKVINDFIPTFSQDHHGFKFSECRDSCTRDDRYIVSFGVVFAGKFYPGAEVCKHYLDTPQRFYTLESFVKYLDKVDLGYMLQGNRRRVYDDRIQKIKNWFSLIGSDYISGWAAENKVAIATDWNSNLPNIHGITINPCLKILDFQKILDPITAYQELDMWINGVLTEPDPPNPVPDIQKVINHGFDPKLSFRKPKEK